MKKIHNADVEKYQEYWDEANERLFVIKKEDNEDLMEQLRTLLIDYKEMENIPDNIFIKGIVLKQNPKTKTYELINEHWNDALMLKNLRFNK